MLYKNTNNKSGPYFSGWAGVGPGLLPAMAPFLKVNGKYRSKSQGKGAVTPGAQGSALTTKLFLSLFWFDSC